MLLKYFYDPLLAHASYLVGCQKTGEATIVDPGRDIEPYLLAAKKEGLRITAAAETHIHADFVSGSRELADRLGAILYLSDEGPAEWKYLFADQYQSQLLKHGDVFHVGNLRLEALHTPGHTPEHLSYLLTDEGGGATEPMGIFTGDFVFVGSIGRPDLLETAAGVIGSAETGARQLYHSMLRFRQLPEYLQVWPAHGAGSACGKGLGAVPSTTVGYEKRFNPALQFDVEQAFVDYILADQPETPPYFAIMKQVNKVGPELIAHLGEVPLMAIDTLPSQAKSKLVIDTRTAAQFAQAHAPGTINIPANSLVRWAGFLVDYSQPVYLLTDQDTLPEQVTRLRSIGIDHLAGCYRADAVDQAGLFTQAYASGTPAELAKPIEQGEVQVVDVRSLAEFQAGHLPQANHLFLGFLTKHVAQLNRSQPVVIHCQGGGRAAIAASLLQREGFEAINLTGGFKAWQAASFPVEQSSTACNSEAECRK